MESLQPTNKDELDNHRDELKAHDKLTLRREARRRKILENAKSRLEKLNGRTTDNNVPITAKSSESHVEHHMHEYFTGPNYYQNGEFSDPEVEPDIIPQQVRTEQSMDIGNLFSSLNTETTSPQQKRHIILRARLHLIISALLSCILTVVFHGTSLTSYSIFILAGLCVIIDLLFVREQRPLNPVISLIATMCNIRLTSQLKNILHLFWIIQSLIVDLGVFVFSFCIFTYIFAHMNSRYTDLIEIK